MVSFLVIWVSVYMRAQSLSHVQLFVTPWTVACQVLLSMAFPRQEYRSGLPFPLLGDLPNPGIETHVACVTCTGGQSLYHWVTWGALNMRDIS